MRGDASPPGSAPGPWYATKRLFASLATAIFRKICRAPQGQKHKYGMGAPHRAS